MATHLLKCWPEFFHAIDNGTKPFELREDDRKYACGDVLVLREWMPPVANSTVPADYTGRILLRRVTYVLHSSPSLTTAGLRSGWVVMGLSDIDAPAGPR